MTNNTTTLIELIADSGYIISNGFENLGKKVYLPLNTDISNYKQVLESQIIDPILVKKLALKLALIQSGISTSGITSSLEADNIITRLTDADFFEKDNAIISSMANSLGISTEQLEEFFILSK